MTAKEYLEQAHRLDQRIDSKLEQVEALRCLATKSTAIIRSHPGGGGNGSFMEDAVIKIVDLEREIAKEMERLVDLKREIAETINRVEEPELQIVLERRYLNYQRWPEIAKAICYSTKTVRRWHEKALEKVEEVIRKQNIKKRTDSQNIVHI